MGQFSVQINNGSLIGEVQEVIEDKNSAVRDFFDAQSLRNLMVDLTGDGKDKYFPGGANPIYMLIHIVELHHWMRDYQVTVA